MAGENDDDDGGAQAAVEKEARDMGWLSEEHYKGPPGGWKTAEEYVARGKEVLPIIRSNNRKLLNELNDTRQKLADLQGALTTQQQTTKDLLEHQAAEVKRQVEGKLAELRADKKAAIKDGDHDLAADLEEEIDKTKDRLAEASKTKPAASPPPAPQGVKVEPWAQAFADDNAEWLGVDKRKSALFQGIAQDLFETTNLRAADLLAEAKKEMDKMLDKPTPQRMGKSEGGSGGWEGSSGGGGSRSGGGSTFNDLPADAKAVCNAQEKKFVGEGKAFKTQAEWRTHYAKTVLG